MDTDFNEKLKTWVNGVNVMITKYFNEHYKNLSPKVEIFSTLIMG